MNRYIILLLAIIPSLLYSKNFYSIKINKGFQTNAYILDKGTEDLEGAYIDLDTIGLSLDITPVKKLGLWTNLGINYLLNMSAITTDLTGVKYTSDTDLNYTVDLNLGFSYTSKSKIVKQQFCIGAHLNWLTLEDNNSLTTGIGGQYSILFPIKETWLNISLISNYDFYEIYTNMDENLDYIASYMAALQIGIGL